MEYQYSHLIKQNIAPKGVKKLVIFNSNNEVCSEIPLGRLIRPNDSKLYSIGLLSDLHIMQTDLEPSYKNGEKLRNAITYFISQGAKMVCHSGDYTNIGFWYNTEDTTIYLKQFEHYKSICDSFSIPVYGICGNHESYNKDITNNLSELKTYTGNGLYYSIPYNNDLYIFIGQPKATVPMSDEALQWLYEILEVNRNKRCFIFVHPFISGDSGNALEVYGNKIFDWWGTKTTAFKNLLKHYKNTILFHGHSHLNFEMQEFEAKANYCDSNGFKSVHIPSCANTMEIIEGVRVNCTDYTSSGYLCDVYPEYIVLNGIDFTNGNKPLPLGTYKIDTTLVNVEAKTFVDSTGTITV